LIALQILAGVCALAGIAIAIAGVFGIRRTRHRRNNPAPGPSMWAHPDERGAALKLSGRRRS